MYGLLGRKLGHSLSPEIHSLFGSYPYKLFCREENELDDFFNDKSITAFNVTIPYKVEAFNRCDEVSEIAKKIGSVNTVVRRADGTLYGDNTDYFGFMKTAEKIGADFNGKKVLVLGSGGASLTVQAVARDGGAKEIVAVSRKGENNYNNIANHFDADIIVNATPVGMFPNNGKKLIELADFPRAQCVLDLIYNPLKTSLLLEAEKLGIKRSNGLYMLVAQGLCSSEIFTGKKLDEKLIDIAYKKITEQSRNIVLIGMPGCGKTTVGKIIAKKVSKSFIDTDRKIVEKTEKNISEILEENGEIFFREIEAEAVAESTKNLGCVIATGGGAIIKKENRLAMKQNGIIVYIMRDLSKLKRTGRPLSSDTDKLKKLYSERKEIYEELADITVMAADTVEETAERVMKCLYL